MSAATSALSAPHQVNATDATGGIIPYKNVPALAAYYLGIFSLLPLVGLLPAVFAVPLAIMGIRKRMKNPAVRGSVHAVVGLVTGTLGLVVWGGLVVLVLSAAFQS